MRYWFLPAILIVYGLLSVLTLSSIAPELAAKQLGFFVVGGSVFFIISRLSWKRIEMLSPIGYAVTIFLLILTLVIAAQTRNTARWIDFGGLFALQASQLAIPLVGLFLSVTLQNLDAFKKVTILQLVRISGIVGIPALLILVEPDLGTTIVYLASLATLGLFLKLEKKHLFSLIALVLMTIVVSWFLILKPYQKQRITSFVNPTADITGAGYNANQSMIAVGSGMFWGRGLGQGVQSYLNFLPERQTDFIFASIAEEFGFIGSIVIVCLYLALVLFLLRTAFISKNTAASLFTFIVVAQITLQTFVNIGMNMGMLPITGITLPLLSYGGSSVITLCATLGLIQSDLGEQKKELTLHLS